LEIAVNPRLIDSVSARNRIDLKETSRIAGIGASEEFRPRPDQAPRQNADSTVITPFPDDSDSFGAPLEVDAQLQGKRSRRDAGHELRGFLSIDKLVASNSLLC
jgi:hypothetical protein